MFVLFQASTGMSTVSQAAQRLSRLFARLTEPLPFLSDDHERQRSHVFSLGSLSGIGFTLLTFGYMAFIDRGPVWQSGLALTMFIGFSLTYTISRTHYYAWGKLIINALAMILFLIIVYFDPTTPSLIMALLPVYLAGYYDELRYALINWLLMIGLMLFARVWLSGNWFESNTFILMMIIFGALTIIQMSITRAVQRKLVGQKRELAVSQMRLRAAIDSSQHLFMLLEPIRDQTGQVIDYELADLNTRLREEYHMAPGLRMSQWENSLISPQLRRKVALTMLGVLESRQPATGEYELTDGRTYEYEIVSAGDGLALSANDITDRRLVEAQRFALQAEQQRVVTLQKLVESLSHDFNTHLAIIRLAVYLAGKASDNSPKVDAKLTQIAEHTEQLIRMVADMLELAHLDDDAALELAYSETPLSELLERLVGSLQKINSKRQTLRLVVTACDAAIWIDRQRLTMALFHVLDNAIKFTPESGEILVSCTGDAQHVVIEILDSGSGIAAADLPHIFEHFYRGAAHRPADSGSGLGLSIAKRIVEAHGGSIQAENAAAGGARIRVTLPTAPRPDAVPPSA